MEDMDYRTEEICILYIKKLLDKFYVYVYLGVAKSRVYNISCYQLWNLLTWNQKLGNFKPHKL